MYPANHFYGHAEIFHEYCGLTSPRPLHGFLMHGWTPALGLKVKPARHYLPKYVWSRRNLETCQAAGWFGVHAVGSPFLYMDCPESVAAPPGKSLLAFPFHGYEQGEINADYQWYAKSLLQLEKDGFGPITVCMYWQEYENADFRSVFERQGWDVVCNGYRDNNPRFLYEQRDLLARHAYTTSNRICTATFYALVCNRPFFLHGPTMGLEATQDKDGIAYDDWQRLHFPQLTYEQFDGSCHRALAEEELGQEYVRSPEDLRDLFQWSWKYALHHAARPLRRAWWKLKTAA